METHETWRTYLTSLESHPDTPLSTIRAGYDQYLTLYPYSVSSWRRYAQHVEREREGENRARIEREPREEDRGDQIEQQNQQKQHEIDQIYQKATENLPY